MSRPAANNSGFYQQSFSADERTSFQAAPRDAGLAEEIALVRLRIRQLAELTGAGQEPTVAQHTLLLRAIDLLARLIRVQSELQPSQEDLLAELNEAVLRKLESRE